MSLLVVAATLLSSACTREPAGSTTTAEVPMPDTIPGVFTGTFPCENCAGIEVALWLRPDGLFFLRQVYSATEDEDASTIYGTGSWVWEPGRGGLVLIGRGPDRVFENEAPGELRLRTSAALPHRLRADVGRPPFEDVLPMEGMYLVHARGPALVECASGVELPLHESGAYADLRRRNRSLNREGIPIFAQLAVHFVAYGTAAEALVVDEVVTLKPGHRCRAGRADR